ncbi:unnamed protein product [Nesidiocoris tenuis]|uniref:Integrase catalytic domain-containing protein n=1 Tax=Nesidiocoris tenuis TaxID=355587 RepID=A0A6H5G443_9HEMI|nr:unnamed protein product [Nesidiocoris tenuis]
MDLLNRKFHEFAMDYGFQVKTSSPHFSQSNGFIKSEVKNLKSHLLKSEDPFKVLLMLRTTSLANGYSSAELLMGRKLRGLVPQAPGNLMPLQVNLDNLFNFEEMRINAQKRNFNQHHGSRPLLPLEAGKEVFVTDRQQSGIVLKEHEAPRSYLLDSHTCAFFSASCVLLDEISLAASQFAQVHIKNFFTTPPENFFFHVSESKLKYCDRPKIENRNGASEKHFLIHIYLKSLPEQVSEASDILHHGDDAQVAALPVEPKTSFSQKTRLTRFNRFTVDITALQISSLSINFITMRSISESFRYCSSKICVRSTISSMSISTAKCQITVLQIRAYERTPSCKKSVSRVGMHLIRN